MIRMRLVHRGAPAGEVAAYGLLTALGVGLLATSFGYGIFGDGGQVGPGFLPAVVGLLLAALAGGEFAARLRGTRTPHHSALDDVALPVQRDATTATPTPVQADDDIDVLGRSKTDRVRSLWVVIAATFVAILLVPVAGFLLAFGALTFFVSAVVERRPLLAAAAITVVALAAIYAVFVLFLGVPLPAGMLGSGG
jgi:putative tricarboxylic transport membrane protein